MMPARSLVRMIAGNTLRSRRHFVLSAFGIVIGIATFVVFLASTEQVGAVLEKIFPVEQVQVVAPRASLLGKDISKKLDDAIVEKIRSRPEVDRANPTAVVPRMALAFPAFGHGSFEGNDLRFEVGGFADGINPDYVQDDDRTRELFKDWDSVKDDPRRVACVPPPPDPNEEVIQSPRAAPKNPLPGVYYNPCPSPERYYCSEVDRTCHHRVPVVMSPTMIELYNGQFARSHGLPMADVDFVKFLTARGGLGAMRFSVGLGLTTIAGSNAVTARKAHRVEAVLVGINNKAMPIGMTMPIQYIQRWNREFLGDEAATTYSSIIVRLRDRNRIAVFAQWLQDDLDLRLEDSLGEKFATALFVIRLVLVLISLVIITISSINIAHNFHAGHRAPPRAGPAARGRRDPERRAAGRARRGGADRLDRRPDRARDRGRPRGRDRLGVRPLSAAVPVQAGQLVSLQVVDRRGGARVLDRVLGARRLLAGAPGVDDGASSGTYPELTLGG
jgi:hypothetical protein